VLPEEIRRFRDPTETDFFEIQSALRQLKAETMLSERRGKYVKVWVGVLGQE
jgi:hypothetical protein